MNFPAQTVDDSSVSGVAPSRAIVLGRYEVESLLGAGASGAVYRGRSLCCGTPVAIKVEQHSTPLQRERFEREAALLAQIGSPHVVAVKDFGHLEDGSAVVVMELVAGTPLDRYVAARGGWLPWRAAVNLSLGMLDGLDAAHEAGVLHRDVKPQNILVIEGEVPVVKLVDFGIARSIAAVGAKLTVAGQVLGSLGYMAPEQVGGDPVDVRSDVYAAGSVLFELLSGTLPFAGGGIKLAMQKLTSEGPTAIPLPVGAAPWPDELTELVLSMLAGDPELRPATAYDAALQLKILLRRTISRAPIR